MNAVAKKGHSYVAAIQQKAETRSMVRTGPVPDDRIPLMVTFDRAWPILSTLFQFVGAGLVLGAAAMWVMPGSQVDLDLIPLKFGASVFMLFIGVAILVLSHSDNRPDAFFDPIRREIRVLQKSKSGRPKTVLRRSYDSLGSARFTEKTLELYDMDGSALMRLKIESPEIRHALRLQLCDCVQITS